MFKESFDIPVPTRLNRSNSLFYMLTKHETLVILHVILHEIVTNYVKHILPGFKMRRMQANGFCILHVFGVGIFRLRDIHKTIPNVQEMLKNQLEKNKEHYSHFSAEN